MKEATPKMVSIAAEIVDWEREQFEAKNRATCAAEGHDAAIAEHDPVIAKMFVCRRCGRYARTHEELEAMR